MPQYTLTITVPIHANDQLGAEREANHLLAQLTGLGEEFVYGLSRDPEVLPEDADHEPQA